MNTYLFGVDFVDENEPAATFTMQDVTSNEALRRLLTEVVTLRTPQIRRIYILESSERA